MKLKMRFALGVRAVDKVMESGVNGGEEKGMCESVEEFRVGGTEEEGEEGGGRRVRGRGSAV